MSFAAYHREPCSFETIHVHCELRRADTCQYPWRLKCERNGGEQGNFEWNFCKSFNDDNRIQIVLLILAKRGLASERANTFQSVSPWSIMARTPKILTCNWTMRTEWIETPWMQSDWNYIYSNLSHWTNWKRCLTDLHHVNRVVVTWKLNTKICRELLVNQKDKKPR